MAKRRRFVPKKQPSRAWVWALLGAAAMLGGLLLCVGSGAWRSVPGLTLRGEYVVERALPVDVYRNEGKVARFTASTFETASGVCRYEDLGSGRVQIADYIYRYWREDGRLHLHNGADHWVLRPR